MGTGDQPRILAATGQKLCRVIAALKGWRHRSLLIDNMAFGGYNRKFEPGKTGKEWLSSDSKIPKKYVKDPFCSFRFTVGAYYQMFEGIKIAAGKKVQRQFRSICRFSLWQERMIRWEHLEKV